MADKKRPPPLEQILNRGFKVDERGKIKPLISQNRRHQQMRPISEEEKKAIKAFQELMKLTPAEREKIRKDKWEEEQRRKKLVKEYRNTWVGNAGTKPKKYTNSLKF